MSFLEMLDVVNERLIDEGGEPIAFDHDCREGICGTCGLMINGQAHGPAAGHGDLPAAHAQVRRRRRRSPSSRGGPRRSRSIKDLMVDRSAFDRDHRGGRLHHAPHRRRAGRQPHPDPQGRWPTRRWTPPRASAAAPAWPPARTAPPSCSPRPRSPTSTCCPRASPSAATGSRRWSRRWRSYFGSCTNHGECEEACPKEISHRLHRPHEPGLPEGEGEEPQARRPRE